jgi:hypothetical protein
MRLADCTDEHACAGVKARLLVKFRRLFSRIDSGDLGMVLFIAQKMARRKAV